MLPSFQVQDISPGRLEAYVVRFYTLLMLKFLAARSRIPPGNLVIVPKATGFPPARGNDEG